jgi:protein SCO1/2
MRVLLAFFLVAQALAVRPASAQGYPGGAHDETVRPVPGLDRIGVDEQLGHALPLDVTMKRHDGRVVSLRDYFDGERPVLLTFAYHSCLTLCSMVLDAATRAVSGVEWTAGDQYRLVTISIDPKDTPAAAAAKRREILQRYGRTVDERGWDFLVADEETIRRLTDAAGYRFFYDARQQQFGHPAAFMFLSPDGRFMRYLYGLELTSSDVRLALLEASEGHATSTVEQVLLYCYSYDPTVGSYTIMATRIMQIGGLLTLLVVGGFIVFLWRRDKRRRQQQQPNDSVAGVGSPADQVSAP